MSNTTLHFRPVTKDNFNALFKLRVAPEQAAWVEPNRLSLIESAFITGYHTEALYADETLVGLVHWYVENETTHYWLDRLMIGADHQRRGYGTVALQQLIARFSALPDCTAIYLSHHADNAIAASWYARHGFVATGALDPNGELILKRPNTPPSGVVPITRHNYAACVALQVSDAQRGWVAPNDYSLVEAHYEGDLVPLGYYVNGQMVGFGMYSSTLDSDENAYPIYRLMIDAALQGHGYGRAALRAMMAHMQATLPACQRIGISFEPDNTPAQKLYESEGFVLTGRMVEGEALAVWAKVAGE
jgi:diamine N-acetyltransferase